MKRPSRAGVRVIVAALAFAALPVHADAAEGGAWWVSLGVYATDAAAERQRARLADSARVVAFDRDARTLQRVVVGPFANAGTAAHEARRWRARVPGAFPLRLDAEGATPDAAVAAAPAGPVVAAAAAAATPENDAREDAAPAAPEPAAPAAPEQAAAPVPARPSRPAEVDAAFRLDPGMERLLRDDAALARELERISRGLPRQLSGEIESARRDGVSIKEVRERMAEARSAPIEAPPGYQLHRLHRDGAAPPAAEE